ncbi:hypothetical protein PS655_03123 [Pseudomonas fluorescens]|uniref:Hydrolase n=1 Tax=Pseudomonas fluorescens TaxID=294 RepID=A0A5E6TUK1_PSEFL|nr:hypothetical protein PS655_03123 [Pseudomonas fluorescens]
MTTQYKRLDKNNAAVLLVDHQALGHVQRTDPRIGVESHVQRRCAIDDLVRSGL